MATRSAIAVMHGNRAKAIYAHWDGYLDHNGRILQEHYDSVKANKLISMGGVSSLRANIGEAHPFSQFEITDTDPDFDAKMALHKQADEEEWCTFYIRDRGEEGAEFKSFDTYDAFRDYYLGSGCEYFYIMKDGVWYYSTYKDETLKLVADGLADLANAEEEVAF